MTGFTCGILGWLDQLWLDQLTYPVVRGDFATKQSPLAGGFLNPNTMTAEEQIIRDVLARRNTNVILVSVIPGEWNHDGTSRYEYAVKVRLSEKTGNFELSNHYQLRMRTPDKEKEYALLLPYPDPSRFTKSSAQEEDSSHRGPDKSEYCVLWINNVSSEEIGLYDGMVLKDFKLVKRA